MKKRLVVSFDGTWNDPEKAETNVIRLARCVKPLADDGAPQIVFYDKGVGTAGPLERFLGGIIGWGLDKNVQDGYRFIAHNYIEGDEIYLFGFSRGAYTARSLAGLIKRVGILHKAQMDRLPLAWNLYRKRGKRLTDAEQKQLVALHDAGLATPDIVCLGIWDTVGALGVRCAF